MGQADPSWVGLSQDLFTIWERILAVASSHGKRLEQIVNRKPSARLRPSAKENIISDCIFWLHKYQSSGSSPFIVFTFADMIDIRVFSDTYSYDYYTV